MFKTTTQTRAQVLADSIEASIGERGLVPGARITTMDEVRCQTGLGRATISEAARLLAERGTVQIRPGRGGGLFVAAADPVVRLRHTLLSVPNGGTSVADAIVVREALEEALDTDACRHRTPADVADLRRLLAELRRSARSTEKFMRANWKLHERIALITPNDMLRGVYLGTLRCISVLSTGARTDSVTSASGYVKDRVTIHVDLIEAIIAGDVDATVETVARHRGLTANAPYRDTTVI